jgi:hypothetical protein
MCYRQLLKDYDARLMFGFTTAMQMLPMILCKKEDAVGQNDLDLTNITTKEGAEKLAKDGKEMFEKMMKNEPQIKMVLGGSILEMIEKGVIEL